MPDELSQVFAALADSTRRDMVARLASGDATVGELAEPFEMSMQAVSKHLRVLEDAGLVSKRREAQRRPVHLEAEVFDLMTKWIERYQREAEERFSRLDDLLDRMDEDKSAATTDDDPSDTAGEPMTEGKEMNSTTREAKIVADPDVPTVTITREFDAPPEKVFRAWAEPDLVRQWMGPHSVEVDIETWDCCTGGNYRYAVLEDGEEAARFYGSFHEARPGERLVQTWTWEGLPDAVALEIMTFERFEDNRCRLVSLSIVESMEAQAAMMASGMEVGINEGYEKLDELLAGGAV